MTSKRTDRSVLEERAASLAVQTQELSGTPVLEVVTVTVVGGRAYAVQTRHVKQILRNVRICRLPAEAGELVGLATMHGTAVPVADLASLLRLTAPDSTRPFVVVLDVDQQPLGVLVDEVLSFGRLDESSLSPPPAGAEGVGRVESAVTSDGVVLLDADLLLADPRITSSARTAPLTIGSHLRPRSGEPCAP